MRRYFEPSHYRVILFDQRGCGRSKPHASVEDNTTWHLVRDIEAIRKTLTIDKWTVFGGSWGATLALIYAETHPESVERLVLRGVFLGTQNELDWFYGGGAGRFWPETWERFVGLIPERERGDLIAAYHKRLFFPATGHRKPCLRKPGRDGKMLWHQCVPVGMVAMRGGEYARAFARLENHYFTHKVFLDRDQQIMDRLDRIADIPGVIVQGRYDMICPPETAYQLANKWKNADLRMIPIAGHALSEPGISAELRRVMDAQAGL